MVVYFCHSLLSKSQANGQCPFTQPYTRSYNSSPSQVEDAFLELGPIGGRPKDRELDLFFAERTDELKSLDAFGCVRDFKLPRP